MFVAENVPSTLQLLEEELLTAAVRRDPERLRELLSADFEEVGASGRVYDREATVRALATEPASDGTVRLERFSIRMLSGDLVQVRYRSRQSGVNGERVAERTSLWRLGAQGWRMFFHQGTPVPSSDSDATAGTA